MTPILNRIPCCPHGDKSRISPDLVNVLNKIEISLDLELHYNSGYRCTDCNKAAGGVPDSAHLRGEAVDIFCPVGSLRFKILGEAIRHDIRRIGIGKTFIHLDVDDTLPQRVVWVY